MMITALLFAVGRMRLRRLTAIPGVLPAWMRVEGFAASAGALLAAGWVMAAPTAGSDAIDLATQCPASFDRLPDNTCAFVSLYDLYDSPPGHGGLRAKLPAARQGFTPQQIDLGRYLFFDPVLSRDHTLSCAHCHQPDRGFSDGRARSMGRGGVGEGVHRHGGDELPRSAPTLWNVGFLKTLFWDGRSGTLEEQAKGPLFTPTEMNNSSEQLEADLNAIAEYRKLFAQAFAAGASQKVTLAQVERALAAFQSTLISLNSRYDRYAYGQEDALNEQEKRGHAIFRGSIVRCSQCHTPPLFTTEELAVTGVPPARGRPFDAGAGAFDPADTLKGAFKTPTLRNIALTAPYMHAGQFRTLREAVVFYNDRRGHAAPPDQHLQIHWNIALTRPVLSEGEIDDLVAFLETLTDESMKPATPRQVPSGLAVVRAQTQDPRVARVR
jgi:cytochrome c peroxidase